MTVCVKAGTYEVEGHKVEVLTDQFMASPLMAQHWRVDGQMLIAGSAPPDFLLRFIKEKRRAAS